MKRKIIFIVIIVVILMLVTGCEDKQGKQEVHTKEDLLYTIDYLDCSKPNDGRGLAVKGAYTTDEDLLSCHLKDKYTVVEEELTEDEQGNPLRKLVLRLNAYDVAFSVVSSKQCSQEFSANCLDTAYVITTDYQEKAIEYFEKKYKETNPNELCSRSSKFCSITKKSEIENAAQYIMNYVDFINNLDIRVLTPTNGIHYYGVYIDFPGKSYYGDEPYYMMIAFALVDGKYTLIDADRNLIDSKERLAEYIQENTEKRNVF